MIFIGDFSVSDSGGTPLELTQMLSINGYSFDRTVVNGSSINDADAFVASGEERPTINDLLVDDGVYYITARNLSISGAVSSAVVAAISADGTTIWERRFDVLLGHGVIPRTIKDLGSSIRVLIDHSYNTPVVDTTYWFYEIDKVTGAIIGNPVPWEGRPVETVPLPNGGSLTFTTSEFFFFDSGGAFVSGFDNNDSTFNYYYSPYEVKLIGDKIYTAGWYYDYLNYTTTNTYSFSAAQCYNLDGSLAWGTASSDEIDNNTDTRSFLVDNRAVITDAGEIYIAELYDSDRRNITVNGTLFDYYVEQPFMVVRKIDNQGTVVWRKKFSNDSLPVGTKRQLATTLTVDSTQLAFALGSHIIICDLNGNILTERLVDIMASNDIATNGEDLPINQLILSENGLQTVWSNVWMQTDARYRGAHILTTPKAMDSYVDIDGHALVWEHDTVFDVTSVDHTSLYQISTLGTFTPVSITYTWTTPVAFPPLVASTRLATTLDTVNEVRVTPTLTGDHFLLNYGLSETDMTEVYYDEGLYSGKIGFLGACSDDLGNFYIYGQQAFFNVGAVTENQHGFVMKVSPSGSILWSKKLQRTLTLNDKLYDMTVRNGVVHVFKGHSTTGSAGSRLGGEIVRLSSADGTFIDTRSYRNMNLSFDGSIVAMPTANIVAVAYAGEFFQNNDSGSSWWAWLSIVDCSTNTTSVNVRYTDPGENQCFPERLALASDGFRMLFSVFTSPNRSFSVARLDSSGLLVWQKRLSLSKANRRLRVINNTSTNDTSLVVDELDNSYALFTVERSDGIFTADYTDPEVVIVKFDNLGNVVWSKSYLTSLPNIDNYRCRAVSMIYRNGKLHLALRGGRRMQTFAGSAPAYITINTDGTVDNAGTLVAHATETFLLTANLIVPFENSVGMVCNYGNEPTGIGVLLNIPYEPLNPQIELFPFKLPKGHYFYGMSVAVDDYPVITVDGAITAEAVAPGTVDIGTYTATADLHPKIVATRTSFQP